MPLSMSLMKILRCCLEYNLMSVDNSWYQLLTAEHIWRQNGLQKPQYEVSRHVINTTKFYDLPLGHCCFTTHCKELTWCFIAVYPAIIPLPGVTVTSHNSSFKFLTSTVEHLLKSPKTNLVLFSFHNMGFETLLWHYFLKFLTSYKIAILMSPAHALISHILNVILIKQKLYSFSSHIQSQMGNVQVQWHKGYRKRSWSVHTVWLHKF